MKYIKTYEIQATKVIKVGQLAKPILKKSARKKLPQPGDYVVMHNKFLDRLRSDVFEFFKFTSENVGLVINFKLPQYQILKEFWWNSDLKYGGYRIVEYDYLPKIVLQTYPNFVDLPEIGRAFPNPRRRYISSDLDIVEFNNKYYKVFSCSDIRFFSKSREECEMFINVEKYNL